jgi:type IV pilus assembly protein PilC
LDNFAYVAILPNGKEKKGSLQAENEEFVRKSLKSEGMIVTRITKQNAMTKDLSFSLFKKKIKPRDLSVFCRQFVSIIGAGVPIGQAMDMLQEQTENKRLATAIKNANEGIRKGETLSSSMAAQKDVFPTMLDNMVEAGEASGSIDVAFDRMGTQFEKDAKLSGMMKKAMIYPCVVGVVAIAVIIVLMVVVVPTFSSMFEQIGTELPGLMKGIIATSNFIVNKWYILIAVVVALVVGIKTFAKSIKGQEVFGKLAMKAPIFGNLTIKNACSKFARTMSTLLAAGIPMIEALDITSRNMSNIHFKRALENAEDDVAKGIPLSVSLTSANIFPPMVVHMIKIGEETGNIESMLDKLADYYDEEVELATQAVMAAMEPLIIVVMALIVGTIVIAIIQTMAAMYGGLGNV